MTASPETTHQLTDLMNQCQEAMAHAWVVRAFLRHCDEAEDFPELTLISRSIFDVSRALETRVTEPIGYFKMLNKKLAKFRTAVESYAASVPEISSHTNFVQSVISLRGTVKMLEHALSQARELMLQTAPTKSLPPETSK